jgi:hypothetical protein
MAPAPLGSACAVRSGDLRTLCAVDRRSRPRPQPTSCSNPGSSLTPSGCRPVWHPTSGEPGGPWRPDRLVGQLYASITEHVSPPAVAVRAQFVGRQSGPWSVGDPCRRGPGHRLPSDRSHRRESDLAPLRQESAGSPWERPLRGSSNSRTLARAQDLLAPHRPRWPSGPWYERCHEQARDDLATAAGIAADADLAAHVDR